LQSKLTCLWTDTSAPKKYRTAVSLHSHTSHSKEGLYFVAEYASRQPLLNWALTTYSKRSYTRGGITTDFRKAYWTPPLLPLAAFRVERDQIERDLDLASIVSITDHDNIEAPTLLQVVPEGNGVPVSVEWTVPYKNGALHVGIHNLPPARAEAIMAQLSRISKSTICSNTSVSRAWKKHAPRAEDRRAISSARFSSISSKKPLGAFAESPGLGSARNWGASAMRRAICALSHMQSRKSEVTLTNPSVIPL